jgi:IclR family acetate operon transcriptional repressor
VLEGVRRQGYAYDAEESVEGLWAVAACILDRSGQPLAATSIVAPAFRVPQEAVQAWQGLIMDAAAEIGRLLGGVPGGSTA